VSGLSSVVPKEKGNNPCSGAHRAREERSVAVLQTRGQVSSTVGTSERSEDRG
jgi:hypothetical protein